MGVETPLIALFDTDKTLVDFTDIVNLVLNEVMERVFKVRGDLNDLTRDQYSGQSMEYILTTLAGLNTDYEWKRRQEDVKCAIPIYDQRVQEELRNHQSPSSLVLPGVFKFLNSLEANGICRGVFSGTVSGIHSTLLKVTGLGTYFQSAWTSDMNGIETRVDLIRSCYEEIRRAQGIEIPVENVVVFGDAPNDIRSANLFGAKSIGVLVASVFSAAELRQENPAKVYGSFEQCKQIMLELFGLDCN